MICLRSWTQEIKDDPTYFYCPVLSLNIPPLHHHIKEADKIIWGWSITTCAYVFIFILLHLLSFCDGEKCLDHCLPPEMNFFIVKQPEQSQNTGCSAARHFTGNIRRIHLLTRLTSSSSGVSEAWKGETAWKSFHSLFWTRKVLTHNLVFKLIA